MIKRKISKEQVEFITDTVFDIARLFIEGEPKNNEVNNMIVNVTMSNGIITGMFLQGHEYLMTVDKNALTYIN